MAQTSLALLTPRSPLVALPPLVALAALDHLEPWPVKGRETGRKDVAVLGHRD